jgi:hypothetical protein
MENKMSKVNVWTVRVLSCAVGAVLTWMFWRGGSDFKTIIITAYRSVGITIIALLPLAGWAIYTVIRAGSKGDLTLAYIGTTAQRVGLLGTVIGIVAATIAIGDNLNTGAATAVTSALPAVGQALVSTAVGFVIAIVCDFFRYLNVHNANGNN